MYIRATGNISPQKTFGHPPFLEKPVEFFGNRLTCTEPDYKDVIDIKLIRRMSRIIRLGVAAAMECLREAGVTMPDAIVTGTAYGCMEDTGNFLSRMVEFKEELLTPTAFIQSTHNTIGAQIGLMLKCNNYNNAFVHRGFSFESALMDAIMLLKEDEAGHVLVGGIDEITNMSHSILSRIGLYRQNNGSNMKLLTPSLKGTIAGEGASFFLLAKEPSNTDYAKLDALSTFYKPLTNDAIEKNINNFLRDNGISFHEIDLIITGRNGDNGCDKIFDTLQQGIFSNNSTVDFKQLCGDYPTATAFALWVAANIIQSGSIPAALGYKGAANPAKRILIYNHYQQIHHSLLLLSAC
jgi:3-oxoacyl-[acyl-carrier-protein] synthase II